MKTRALQWEETLYSTRVQRLLDWAPSATLHLVHTPVMLCKQVSSWPSKEDFTLHRALHRVSQRLAEPTAASLPFLQHQVAVTFLRPNMGSTQAGGFRRERLAEPCEVFSCAVPHHQPCWVSVIWTAPHSRSLGLPSLALTAWGTPPPLLQGLTVL